MNFAFFNLIHKFMYKIIPDYLTNVIVVFANFSFFFKIVWKSFCDFFDEVLIKKWLKLWEKIIIIISCLVDTVNHYIFNILIDRYYFFFKKQKKNSFVTLKNIKNFLIGEIMLDSVMQMLYNLSNFVEKVVSAMVIV